MLDFTASTDALNRIATALETIASHLERIASPPIPVNEVVSPFGPEYFSQITNSNIWEREEADRLARADAALAELVKGGPVAP